MSSPKSLFCITDGQGILKICMYHWEAKEVLRHFGNGSNTNLSIVRYDLVQDLDFTDVDAKEDYINFSKILYCKL